MGLGRGLPRKISPSLVLLLLEDRDAGSGAFRSMGWTEIGDWVRGPGREIRNK